MARSAASDPIEKFRYRVFVLDSTLADTGSTVQGLLSGVNIPVDQLGSFLGTNSILARGGFSDIELPKGTINEMNYRENNSQFRTNKFAGLTKFEPITLKRGVTTSIELYSWYSLVNNDTTVPNSLATGIYASVTKDQSTPPITSINYRRDVVIQSLDRESNPIKEWRIYNAWPSGYKPGNDLAGNAEEKLIEELTLTYEFFTEQKDNFFNG